MPAQLLLFNKPFQVLCQFTDSGQRRTLADFIDIPGVYPAGRLDYDSEGLVLLTDSGDLQARISAPGSSLWKRYWVQVEGNPDERAIQSLRRGVELKDGTSRPARVHRMNPPQMWERDPPIRRRRNQGVSWLEIQLNEGRNRQVRRMTAAVGHPTLRLIRMAIGDWSLDNLRPGQHRREMVHLPVARRPRRRR